MRTVKSPSIICWTRSGRRLAIQPQLKTSRYASRFDKKVACLSKAQPSLVGRDEVAEGPVSAEGPEIRSLAASSFETRLFLLRDSSPIPDRILNSSSAGDMPSLVP